MKSYKLRKAMVNDGKDPAYSLGLPTELGDALPEGARFTCRFTDEGLLFRPAGADVEQIEVPEWVSELEVA